jgi:predicted negative regulator of RcsB-dependent stress response
MTKAITGKKARLIISLKKRKLFQENADSITGKLDVHAAIRLNEKINKLTRENRKGMNAEQAGIWKAIKFVEAKEKALNELFTSLGLPEEKCSRTLKRLNITEVLLKGEDAEFYGETSTKEAAEYQMAKLQTKEDETIPTINKKRNEENKVTLH